MFRVFILLLALNITLFANYAQAVKYYNVGKYQKAIQVIKASKKQYASSKLHLLSGQSAEKLGKLNEAMSAYERVLMMDPDNVELRVHLTSLYAYLDRDELATKMSKSTENYQLTPAQRNSLNTLKKADAAALKIAATFAIGHDSNINVSPEDLEIPSNDDAISTMFAQFTAHLSYTYALTDNKDWYFRTDSDIFSQTNFESAAEYYNVFAASAKLGLGYRGGAFDMYLPVKYGRMHYLERDFLETIGFEPRVNITFSESLIGNINARYTERSYLDKADKNRDDTIIGYGGGLYWMFDKNFAYLTSNYDDYEAENSKSLLFTDKETFNLSAGVNYNVNDLFITRLGYRYRYTLYGDFLPDGNKQRNDYYNQGEVKVSRIFLDTMEGSLLYRYSTNRSNYELAEYDKDVVLFGLQYNY